MKIKQATGSVKVCGWTITSIPDGLIVGTDPTGVEHTMESFEASDPKLDFGLTRDQARRIMAAMDSFLPD